MRVNEFIDFFFFQAEDGIRDKLVTGVQTCALPIYPEGGMFTMNENAEAWGFLRPLTWQHVLLVLAVFLAAKLLSGGVRWLLQHWAERVRPRLRLSILRLIPLARLVFGTAAVVVAVPILVEPTLRNVVTLVASVRSEEH